MFSFLDIVFGVIALFFLLRGVFRGLFKEITSTVGVVAAYYVASNWNELLVPFFRTWFDSPGILHFLSYVSLFVGVMVGVMFVAWLLARILRLTPVFWVDVPGGAAVGLIKAWLMCCVIFIGLNSFMPDAEFLEKSVTVPYLRAGAAVLEKLLPEDMKDFDPSVLKRKMEQEKREDAGSMFSGSKDGEEKGQQENESGLQLLKRMGDVIKNLKKEKTE